MFFILAGQRAGAHLLLSLLDSHPDLRGWDVNAAAGYTMENILPNVDVYSLGENEGIIIPYIDFAIAADLVAPAMVEHLRHQRCIHLRRADIGQQVRSWCAMMAVLKKEPHPTRVTDAVDIVRQVIYSKKDLLRWAKELETRQERALDIDFTNMYSIWYEEITEGEHISSWSKERAAPLLQFLGVEPMELTTNLVKVGPYPPGCRK